MITCIKLLTMTRTILGCWGQIIVNLLQSEKIRKFNSFYTHTYTDTHTKHMPMCITQSVCEFE